MSDLLIQHARVLQLSAGHASLLDNHDILIRGKTIEAIQPTGQADPTQFKQVIDAAGQVAMPGLINTHAHVPMVIFRGLAEDVNLDSWFNDYIWPIESNLTPDDVYWGMLLGMAEMIEAGVTSVIDHYWHMERAAKAVEEAGMRALLGPAMFSDGGMGQIEEAAAFIQNWQNAADGRIRTMLAPHAPYTCDDEFLKATAQKAHEIGVGIHIHAAETVEQTQISLEKRGKTPIQVLDDTGVLGMPTIIAHALGATPADIELMASSPAGIAHCPKTYFKLAMGYAPLTDFRAAGIPVGLGTDGAMSNATMDIFEAMRLMALGQKTRTKNAETLPIPDALTIATQEAARVYGQPDDLGDLAPGKLADLILIDLSGTHHQPLYSVTASLVYNLRAGDVQTTIINGKIVMRDRQLLTIDKTAVIHHLTTQMDRLSHRPDDKRIQTYNP